MNNYTHLNEENRFEIYEYKQEGLTIREIAEKIGKNPLTISRELIVFLQVLLQVVCKSHQL